MKELYKRCKTEEHITTELSKVTNRNKKEFYSKLLNSNIHLLLNCDRNYPVSQITELINLLTESINNKNLKQEIQFLYKKYKSYRHEDNDVKIYLETNIPQSETNPGKNREIAEVSFYYSGNI
jgi:adenylylsulfate kinase-like enzyme